MGKIVVGYVLIIGGIAMERKRYVLIIRGTTVGQRGYVFIMGA